MRRAMRERVHIIRVVVWAQNWESRIRFQRYCPTPIPCCSFLLSSSLIVNNVREGKERNEVVIHACMYVWPPLDHPSYPLDFAMWFDGSCRLVSSARSPLALLCLPRYSIPPYLSRYNRKKIIKIWKTKRLFYLDTCN